MTDDTRDDSVSQPRKRPRPGADTQMAKAWNLDYSDFASPQAAFCITLAVARYSMLKGYCWATQVEIGQAARCSSKTVARVLAEMEGRDPPWIHRTAARLPDGTRGRDEIWLTLPAVELEADTMTANARRDSRILHARMLGVGPSHPAAKVSDGLIPPSPTDDGQGVRRQADKESEPKLDTSLDSSRPPTPKGALPSDSEIDVAVGLIWDRASSRGRERSSRADIRTALVSCLKRGHPMELILRGMGAYFASPDATKDNGDFQAGPHVKLHKDRWQSFLADMPAAPAVGAPVAVPRPASDIGTDEAPGPALQRAWMGQWKLSGGWDVSVRGPAPGRPGCRVSDAIQREHGAEPFTPADDDSAAFD